MIKTHVDINFTTDEGDMLLNALREISSIRGCSKDEAITYLGDKYYDEEVDNPLQTVPMMNNLTELMSQWSESRGIITGSDSKSQALKMFSEAGELADHVNQGKDVRDDIGDIIVCLNNVAIMSGTSLQECMHIAYDDIKNRDGIMVNNVFIKESSVQEVLGMSLQEAKEKYNK